MADTISGITHLNAAPTQMRVTLINSITKVVVSSQLSNATTGAFSFTGLAAGTYEIVFVKAGYKARCDGPWALDGLAVTWSPTDKHANITLSGGNLIATKTTAADTGNLVRATVGKSTGKHYFEVLCTNVGVSPFNAIGVATSAGATNVWPGTPATGWVYYQETGNKYNNNVGAAYGATWTDNDVIGVAVDMSAGSVTFYKNNVSQGVAYTNVSGTVFPVISLYRHTGPAHVMTGRFKSADFSYAPPAGFSPWDA